jgi:hypothetical protein
MPNFKITTTGQGGYKKEYISIGTVQDSSFSIFFTDSETNEDMEIENCEILEIKHI